LVNEILRRRDGTMIEGGDPARLAHIDLHSEHSIAIHFGLIDNAAEGYTAPVNDLALARNVHGIAEGSFVTPRIGQIFQY
jgi:hypothetical protein